MTQKKVEKSSENYYVHDDVTLLQAKLAKASRKRLDVKKC